MTTRPRRGQRIDYAVLNNTGRIVNRLSITSPTISQAPVDYQYIIVDEESPTKQNITHHVQMTSIISDIVTGMDELTDIMVEHQLETSSQADNAETVKNLKDLRRAVRLQMNELQQIDPSIHGIYKPTYDKTMSSVQEFILKCKNFKSTDQVKTEKELEEKAKLQKKSLTFIINDTNIFLTRLETVFTSNPVDLIDDHLTQAKSQLSEHDKTMARISTNYQTMLKTQSTSELSVRISNVETRYLKLCEQRDKFTDSLNEQFTTRDIDKYKSFKASNLNIEMKKFSGYDSPVDIYTFKSNFYKLNHRDTPTKLLPDLLINNYLAETALSLVKGLTGLFQAYGSSKILLARKLLELKRLDPVRAKADPSKNLKVITTLINVLRDLISLGKQHKIENQLY